MIDISVLKPFKIGQLIQNLICKATSTLEGNKSWRIPFGILFIIPVALIVGVKYLPEVGATSLSRRNKHHNNTLTRTVPTMALD